MEVGAILLGRDGVAAGDTQVGVILLGRDMEVGDTQVGAILLGKDGVAGVVDNCGAH